MKIMGLDIGERRIGVAISDELGIIVERKDVIIRENDTLVFEQIEKLINTYQIKEIVIGLPRQMDGEIGTQAAKTLKFIEAMRLTLSIPVKTWDERFTTKIAKNILKEAPLKKKRQKGIVDKIAAALILQNYLDYKRR